MAGQGATVGISHAKDENLSDEDVLRLVREAVDRAGGISRHVRRNDTVLLKPNQTLWFLAEDGVTTDPRVVAALVTLCRAAGAGHVVVGDSSGGDLRSSRTLEVTGMKRLALDAGADEVVGFEEVEQETVQVEVEGERYDVRVPKIALEAQAVINVPKAKTHFEDLISCSLKNWVGITDQAERPRFMKDPLLSKLTARLHEKVRARLHVVDGLWAGHGNGPAANEPLWLGCVVAGEDPVAVDSTVASLMGFDWRQLVFAGEGERIGLGVRDPGRIRVVGPPLAEVSIRATPTQPGFDHVPIRVLAGEDVTYAGSLGHLKSIADVFHKMGLWAVIDRAFGKPTFMVGRIHDPDFEAHVAEGPYFVIDDAAHDKYRTDPRVTFIPGHPATHNIFPYVFRRLHVATLGPAAMKLQGVMNEARAYFHHRSWKAAPEAEGP